VIHEHHSFHEEDNAQSSHNEKEVETPKPEEAKPDKSKWHHPFGKDAMVAYLICFVGFAVARLILYNEMQHIIIYSSSMFFIGSLAIGGGYAILPLMLTEFTLREYVGPE